MSGQERHDDLTQFETALSKLVPNTADFSRDDILFAAARVAAQVELCPRSSAARWLWPCAAAAMAILALTMTVLWQQQRALYHRTAKLLPEPSAAPGFVTSGNSLTADTNRVNAAAEFSPPAGSYLVLRERVLRGDGWDTLEGPATEAAEHPQPAWPMPRRWAESVTEDG
jgi:hypothetical protein